MQGLKELETEKLKGFQRKYLRGLAHKLNPVVSIGRKGLTDTLMESFEEALESHELIKVKFIDFKEKGKKRELISKLIANSDCELVGIIGPFSMFRQ